VTWQTAMGHADIRASYRRAEGIKKHEFTVTTYQMCILMLFNKVRARVHLGTGAFPCASR
jgi:hypothetical protein